MVHWLKPHNTNTVLSFIRPNRGISPGFNNYFSTFGLGIGLFKAIHFIEITSALDQKYIFQQYTINQYSSENIYCKSLLII